MSSSAGTLVDQGLAFEKAGRLAESIDCFLRAAEAEPAALTYWHLIRTQMQAAQFEQAHRSCKRALTLYPDKARFYRTLARLKDKLGDTDGALEILGRGAGLLPDAADLLSDYAALQTRTMRFAEAIPVIERLITVSPDAAGYRALYKARRAIGGLDSARAAVREGLERFPLDIGLSRYAAGFDPAAALRSRQAMKAALATESWTASVRSPFLRYLTEAQAWANRIATGRSRDGADDWTDLVQWSDPEGMAALVAALDSELTDPAPRAEAVAERAAAAIAQLDWVGAERWFAEARRQSTQTAADVAIFDPGFYGRLESLTDEEIWSPFPPVVDVVAREALPAATIYVACDPRYFTLFVPGLLKSLIEHGSRAGVHIHLLDGEEGDWRRLAATLRDYAPMSLSMTAEGGAHRSLQAGARDYYHAARYVRFHQYLTRAPRPTWLLDADVVAAADTEPLFGVMKDCDFVATTTATCLEPWNKIRAGLVRIAPTAAGLRYARLIAAYISHWFRSDCLRWGIDQQALFGCLFYLEQQGAAPRTRFLGEDVLNEDDARPCIIRPVMDAVSRWHKG